MTCFGDLPKTKKNYDTYKFLISNPGFSEITAYIQAKFCGQLSVHDISRLFFVF